MNFIEKTAAYILFIGALGGGGYFFRDELKELFLPPAPCSKPITYSIGSFDERFGISKEDFIESLIQSEAIWEDAADKNLFSYSATGTMKINLTYDYRQEATDKLSDVGGAISQDKEVYDRIKIEYEGYIREYDRKRLAYDRAVTEYNAAKKEYEEKVDYWNERGGAPQKEYRELQDEKERLNIEASKLDQKALELTSLSKKINASAADLNELAKKLNIKVRTFNVIGASTGEEFNEGEYIRDADGIRINVYQFESKAKLLRLLQHEFGHALGIDHVEDPNAVMYRLNSGNNDDVLTEKDKEALTAACLPS